MRKQNVVLSIPSVDKKETGKISPVSGKQAGNPQKKEEMYVWSFMLEWETLYSTP